MPIYFSMGTKAEKPRFAKVRQIRQKTPIGAAFMIVMVISIITLLNMYHSAREISLMRLIGISMKKINLLYIVQNGIIGLVSTVLAFGLSRLCLTFMSDYVANMGVVLNIARIYPLEIIILLVVFLISVLPTVVCTFLMARKDGIGE